LDVNLRPSLSSGSQVRMLTVPLATNINSVFRLDLSPVFLASEVIPVHSLLIHLDFLQFLCFISSSWVVLH